MAGQMLIRAKVIGLAMALFSMSGSVALAASYNVTFDNVLIDNNPTYPISGSFQFDTAGAQDPAILVWSLKFSGECGHALRRV